MKRTLESLGIIFILLLAASCATTQLRTPRISDIRDIHPAKTYTVFLYGGRHPFGPTSIAILQVEGTPYRIVPFLEKGSYQEIKHQSASRALAIATGYLGKYPLHRFQMRKILDKNGRVIAYDIRPPRYTSHGSIEVLDAHYFLKTGDKVEVRINIPAPYEPLLHQP